MSTTRTKRYTTCERCGRRRPVDPNQHTIAFHHTRVDERIFVCGDCWDRLLEMSHEVGR